MSVSSCGWTTYFNGVNSDQALTHSHFSYEGSVTHPTARTQDISRRRPSSASVNVSPTQGSLLFLLYRYILLTQDACSPLVHICHHKCILHVFVEMTQDVTVKKHVEVLSCTSIKQTFNVPLSCNVCTVRAKTSNVSDTILKQTDDGPSSLQAKYCHWKRFIHSTSSWLTHVKPTQPQLNACCLG